jgi:hypothetical protein
MSTINKLSVLAFGIWGLAWVNDTVAQRVKDDSTTTYQLNRSIWITAYKADSDTDVCSWKTRRVKLPMGFVFTTDGLYTSKRCTTTNSNNTTNSNIYSISFFDYKDKVDPETGGVMSSPLKGILDEELACDARLVSGGSFKTKATDAQEKNHPNSPKYTLFISEGSHDSLTNTTTLKIALRRYARWGFASGILAAPFKVRPGGRTLTNSAGADSTTTSMTLSTDISIGAYLAPRYTISRRRNLHLLVPFHAGLAFINLTSNNTYAGAAKDKVPKADQGDQLVPGISVASGLILDINSFEVAFLFGWDWASGALGKNWLYQPGNDSRPWLSFGIGYSFTRPNAPASSSSQSK